MAKRQINLEKRTARAEVKGAATAATSKPGAIQPAKGKLGIMIPGMGAVATTFVAGVEAVRKGLAQPIGSLRTDSETCLTRSFKGNPFTLNTQSGDASGALEPLLKRRSPPISRRASIPACQGGRRPSRSS